MRILILLRRYKGGVGNANKRLAKAIIKKGHKVNIISREDNLKCFGIKDSIIKIRRYVKDNKGKYDVIYTQDWSMALPLLVPYPIFWRKHFCCFCGNQEGKTKLIQNLIGRIFGKKLVVVADSIKERFPESKLVYRGIDYAEFKPLNKKRSYIGWVEKETELIDEDFVQKLSQKLKMPYLVASTIPPEKMNEFYNKCKVFVSLPPFGAGMNNVWAEAMASGVPIIIGNYNGLGQNWPYQRIDIKKDWVKECVRIVNNPKKINYRKWLKENKIGWENSAEKLIQYFKSFLF